MDNRQLPNTRNSALNTPNASAPGVASTSSALPAQPAEASINQSLSPVAESLKDIYQTQGLKWVEDATARWRKETARWGVESNWSQILSDYYKLVDKSKMLPNETSQYEDDFRKLAIAIALQFASNIGPLSGYEFGLLTELWKKSPHLLSQCTSRYPVNTKASNTHYVLYVAEAFEPVVKHCVANSFDGKAAKCAFNGVWNRLASPLYEPSA